MSTAVKKSMIPGAGMMALLMAGAAVAQQPPPPNIPPEITAILKEHVGRFRSVGEMQASGQTIKFEGTRECEAVQAGAGVLCRWHDALSPSGTPLEDIEILGYDPEAGLLRSARVSHLGVLTTLTINVAGHVMTVRGETVANGETSVRLNEITVVPGGGWTQRFSMDTGGKRVAEGTIRHERLTK